MKNDFTIEFIRKRIKEQQQYLSCLNVEFLYKEGTTDYERHNEVTRSAFGVYEYWNQKLKDKTEQIKVLTLITEQDAEIVGRLLNFQYKPMHNGRAFIKQLIQPASRTPFNFNPHNIIAVIDYLRSKNYKI